MRIFKQFFLFGLCLLFFANSLAAGNAHTHLAPMPPVADPATKMPAIFDGSWIGLSAGAKKTYFTNSDLTPGYAPSSIKNTITALRVTIGHYFNPYIAMSINLMRGAHSNKFIYPGVTTSVAESLFALTLRPTWPLNDTLSLFGEGGVGFISRKGYRINGVDVVSNDDILTAVFGVGFYYNLPYNMFLDLETEYTTPNKAKKQPSIFYVGLGFNYLLKATHSHLQPGKQYWFPKSTLQLNYVNQDLFYWDVARYFTPPKGLPIFFDGHIKVGKGIALTYEKTFFHTFKYFSIEWGWSTSQWQSRMSKQNFYTLSLFPEIKIWMLRSPSFDLFFTYSLAGPTYISKRFIDGSDSGSHFTFQDFLGIGAFLGQSKTVAINFKIIHYSNGNSLPSNPGVCVPVMLGIVVSLP